MSKSKQEAVKVAPSSSYCSDLPGNLCSSNKICSLPSHMTITWTSFRGSLDADARSAAFQLLLDTWPQILVAKPVGPLCSSLSLSHSPLPPSLSLSVWQSELKVQSVASPKRGDYLIMKSCEGRQTVAGTRLPVKLTTV